MLPAPFWVWWPFIWWPSHTQGPISPPPSPRGATESLGSPPRGTENWGRCLTPAEFSRPEKEHSCKPTSPLQASLMAGARAHEQTHSLARAGAGSAPRPPPSCHHSQHPPVIFFLLSHLLWRQGREMPQGDAGKSPLPRIRLLPLHHLGYRPKEGWKAKTTYLGDIAGSIPDRFTEANIAIKQAKCIF